ncbi:MAG: DNA-binding protein [Candidatus Bathyarchaeota archaeon]|nr:MAG: DNA-binding protein [Candidatus Bathyarchaeota archaeon]
MPFAEFDLGKNLVVSADLDSDLVRFLAELAERRGITAAAFTAIGALKCAKLGFYDQEKREYQKITIGSPCEMASCIGNISTKNGKPFVHVHAVLANKDGNTKAGHLLEGVIFVAEIHLRELKGSRLERKHNETTNLSLWDMK